MNNTTRITLQMTLMDAIFAVSEGNPGAITAMVNMSRDYRKLDPQSALDVYMPLLQMDTMGIYAEDIHVLYKYVCGANCDNMAIIMRGVQMGLLSVNAVKQAIAFSKNESKVNAEIDFIGLKAKLQEKLPKFLKCNDPVAV